MRDVSWEERGFRPGSNGEGGRHNSRSENNAQGENNAEVQKSSNPYEINYEDKKFTDVEAAKKEALNDVEATYGDMIGKSDSFYNEQIQASKDWEEQQKQSQQEMTDFAIEKIEQQKEQAEKDYLKEQSGAYTDWQKESMQHGVNAERMASQGMGGTGYSESVQLAKYNTYQYRVSAAREAFSRATLDFDNDIKEAQLQNNSVMAQLAFESYQKRLELALAGFQYKNQLLIEQSDKKLQVDSLYYQRWQDVLAQMNTENSLAEQIRQFNESMALEREQFEWQKEQAMEDEDDGGGGGGGYYYGGTSGGTSGSGLQYSGWTDKGLEDKANSGVIHYETTKTTDTTAEDFKPVKDGKLLM